VASDLNATCTDSADIPPAECTRVSMLGSDRQDRGE
jgi:hypothetical protein